jgi:hypothetical protein
MNSDLSRLAGDGSLDVGTIRARLRKISDSELIKYGKDCAFLCSPKQNFGKPPSPVWKTQLDEARAEWRRRHPTNQAHKHLLFLDAVDQELE